MINKAIEKITKEVSGTNDPALIIIEEHLTNLCKTENIATKILNPEKTLKGAIDAMRNVASKKIKGGTAFLSDAEGFLIVENYFEIKKEDKENILNTQNIMDPLDMI